MQSDLKLMIQPELLLNTRWQALTILPFLFINKSIHVYNAYTHLGHLNLQDGTTFFGCVQPTPGSFGFEKAPAFPHILCHGP